MLTGIQSSEAQDKGIWAWDCLTEEPVLLIPVILALLGDNPMQSELACHIGLCGNFFCRCCWVKGKDADEVVPPRLTIQFDQIDRQCGLRLVLADDLGPLQPDDLALTKALGEIRIRRKGCAHAGAP